MEMLIYEILMEAATGRIYTDRPYNIIFNSIINTTMLSEEEQLMILNKLKRIMGITNSSFNLQINKDNIGFYHKDINKSEFLIPTLKIDNLNEFLDKLQRYLMYAKEFYDKNYYDSIDNEDKTILSLLWSNALSDDFNNPTRFIEERIQFFKDETLQEFSQPNIIGISSILLNSPVRVYIDKEPIYQETPFSFNIELLNENNLDEKYYLPKIRFGINNNICTIMAIQHDKKKGNVDTPFTKKIKRFLNKVNQNFEKEDNFDNIENPENLTGIVPSFLVSITIFISILKAFNIYDIKIASFLPVRWNAKELKYLKKKEIDIAKNIDAKEIEEQYQESIEFHYNIQRNLSDKMIRNFRRIAYHFGNVDIISYPYEYDEFIHVKLNDQYNSNNELLNEIYNLYNVPKKRK